MEKYSPNWLLDKLNSSKTDAHKLMHIIDFQNNVGLHNVTNCFKCGEHIKPELFIKGEKNECAECHYK